MLLVHIVPVLLLALLRAVGGHLAPATLLDGGLVLITTVVAVLPDFLQDHSSHFEFNLI